MWHILHILSWAAANVHWLFWTSITSCQILLTIMCISSDIIGPEVFIDSITSMSMFPTSQWTVWCCGKLCLPHGLHCASWRSPLDLGSVSAWVGVDSVSHDQLRVDYCCSHNGRAKVPAAFWGIGTSAWTITVSEWLCFIHSCTVVVCNDLSCYGWPRSRSCTLQSKLCSSKLKDKVDSALFLPSSLLIHRTVYSSSYFNLMKSQISVTSSTILTDWLWSSICVEQWRFTVFLNACTFTWCASWYFCELLFFTWLAVGSIWWSEHTVGQYWVTVHQCKYSMQSNWITAKHSEEAGSKRIRCNDWWPRKVSGRFNFSTSDLYLVL